MSRCAVTLLTDRLKALAHPVRLRILALLRHGELCVCQVVCILGAANSTVSEHLQALRLAGFVTERKEGRWVYYRLAPDEGLQDLVGALWPHLEGAGSVDQDRQALGGIRQESLESTCARTRGCRPSRQAPLQGARP